MVGIRLGLFEAGGTQGGEEIVVLQAQRVPALRGHFDPNVQHTPRVEERRLARRSQVCPCTGLRAAEAAQQCQQHRDCGKSLRGLTVGTLDHDLGLSCHALRLRCILRAA